MSSPFAHSSLAQLGADLVEHAAVEKYCAKIDRFGRERLDAAKHDREGRLAPAVLAEARELGLFGLSVPREQGGAGLSLQSIGSVVEVLARYDRALATTVGLHVGLGTRALISFGGSELCAKWLPRLASGTCIAAFAATERNAGSDIAALGTTAVDEGATFRIDGEKIYITNGGMAGIYTVLVRTPGQGSRPRHGMMLVERESRGVSTGPEEQKLGLRGASTTRVRFEGVTVPRGNLIGVLGRGLEQLAEVLAFGRTVMASGCCGLARAALQRSIEQVNARVQFGAKLGTFEVVRRQIAEMAAQHFAMVAIARRASSDFRDPDLGVRLSIAAKVFASEAAWQICDAAVQLHGGSGTMDESGLPLLLRDARVMRIFEGANDVLLLHLGAVYAAANPARSALVDHVPRRLIEVAREVDGIDGNLRNFRDQLVRAWGTKLFRQEGELHRLGKSAALALTADAAVLRAAAHDDERSALLAGHFAHTAAVCVEAASQRPFALDSLTSLTDGLYAESTY